MRGELDSRADAQLAWLRGVVDGAGERSADRPRALDLGAGHGADATALARLGYRVVADSWGTVQRMLRAARARVAAGGTLVITCRDLSAELREVDRFFLVRADASRILTCFVEYLPDRAMIHDLVHVSSERGWELRKSCYPKLRLPIARVTEWLVDAGFHDVERVPCADGLIGLVGR